MMADQVGQVVDVSAKLTGVPVAGLVFMGIDVEKYVLYGTAVLVTVSLIKLGHTTLIKLVSTYKSVRQRLRNRKR